MKKFITSGIIIFFVGCSQEVPFSDPKPKVDCLPKTTTYVKPSSAEGKLSDSDILSVTDWGPRSTKVNENPNAQPNGSIGLWLRLNTTKGLTNAVLYIDETRAISTSVIDSSLVTAAVSPDLIATASRKKISLRDEETGIEIFSDFFDVLAN